MTRLNDDRASPDCLPLAVAGTLIYAPDSIDGFAELAVGSHAPNSNPQEASLVAITFESVREFVRTEGEEVTVLASSQAGVKILRNGDVDVVDLIDKATHFVVSGIVYSREQFDEMMSR